MLNAIELRNLADAIPELGHGGREIGDELIQLAAEVKPGESIVDIGPYLGSTTAYLAIGAPPGMPIHAFDTWDAEICDLKKKGRTFNGLKLPDDFLPDFLKNLRPFGANVITHRVDVLHATWSDGPIGLFVDDIGVSMDYTLAKMAAFGPHLVPGCKLVLLDYFWYEKKRGPLFSGQRDYMKQHADRYRFIRRVGPGMAALFETIETMC